MEYDITKIDAYFDKREREVADDVLQQNALKYLKDRVDEMILDFHDGREIDIPMAIDLLVSNARCKLKRMSNAYCFDGYSLVQLAKEANRFKERVFV